MSFKRILYSRRAFTALFSISCLTTISLKNGTDTSMAIATVAVGLAAANSHQRKGLPPDSTKLTDKTHE